MQKWEYCVVFGGWHNDNFDLKRLTDKGTEEMASWEAIKTGLPEGSGLMDGFAQRISHLGEEGWEMVGDGGGGGSGYRFLYFKRPKP